MRWTEIQETARNRGLLCPTYRQMDIWTRAGKLTAKMHGDRHGRFRWWPEDQVDRAFLVARLVSAGLSVDLAFRLAETEDGGAAEVVVAVQPPVRIAVSQP